MILKNAKFLNSQFQWQVGAVEVDGQFIGQIGQFQDKGQNCVDLQGKCLIPGLIDIHTHGCVGEDYSDGDVEGILKMCRYEAENGVTSLVPTTMTLLPDAIEKALDAIRRAKASEDQKGSVIEGINMEGPYLSPKNKGAQNGDWMVQPNAEQFFHFQKISGNLIRLVSIAPELEQSVEFAEKVSPTCRVSMAHTLSDYNTAMKVIESGASHCTHLYNTMPGFHHRNPGIVGAVYDSSVTAELISDGVHIHPAVVRATYRILGRDRLVFISDSMRATGLSDGKYTLGGQEVFVKGKEARLEDGTLAGSASNVMDCVRKAISFGVPMEDAVRAATINPARVIGADREIGSIETGKYANLVVLDENLEVETVLIRGAALSPGSK